jgi:hypothetical protein
MLFTVHCTGGFNRKPYSTLVFKIHKKNRETGKLNSILQNGKIRVANQTKLKSKTTRVIAQKAQLKMRFKNSISGEADCFFLASNHVNTEIVAHLVESD